MPAVYAVSQLVEVVQDVCIDLKTSIVIDLRRHAGNDGVDILDRVVDFPLEFCPWAASAGYVESPAAFLRNASSWIAF